jgi:hypothetical protein
MMRLIIHAANPGISFEYRATDERMTAMIAEKVLGVYASVGFLSPAEQAEWYRRASREWGINTFELPLLAGVPLPSELMEAFSDLRASLVVTLVAQWATVGQKNPAYGLSSVEKSARMTSVLDVCSVLQQCQELSLQGACIRNVVVHTGQRSGHPVRQAIALSRSLVDLRRAMAPIFPDCALTVEVTDCLPADHPIPFPAAKKASLTLPDLIESLAGVNQETAPGGPISLMVNWGRLLINGDLPLSILDQILVSEVPLAGVILSGAGASEDGFRDSHNSHLDPDSGFTTADAEACATALKSSPQSTFLGMKCSRAKGDGEISIEEVLTAQAQLLNQIT